MSTDYGNEYAYEYVLESEGIDLGSWYGDGIEWGVELSTVDDPQFGNEPNGGKQTVAEVQLTRPMRRSGRPTFASDAATLQWLVEHGGKRKIVLKQYEKDDDGIRQSPPLGVHPGTLGGCVGPNAGASESASELQLTVMVKRR